MYWVRFICSLGTVINILPMGLSAVSGFLSVEGSKLTEKLSEKLSDFVTS